MPKNPEQLRGIDWESIIRVIWGTVLPHLAGIIRERTSLISERVLPERIRDLIASLIGAGAQIFEKEFKGVHFEILSDVFEQVSTGIKAPIEERKKAKPEEVRKKYEWPKLEELEVIKQAKEISVKRDLLLKLSSQNLHENIKSLSDKEIEDLIDVLIQLEKIRKEITEKGFPLSLKSIWETIKESFKEIASITRRGLKETARFIKENYPKFADYMKTKTEDLDKKANELASKLEEINKKSKKWRLF